MYKRARCLSAGAEAQGRAGPRPDLSELSEAAELAAENARLRADLHEARVRIAELEHLLRAPACPRDWSATYTS